MRMVYSQIVSVLAKKAWTGQEVILGSFIGKDLAQRIAKAYIHAMVLCHKPEAPSLF